MDEAKKRKLEAAGWKSGTVAEFLQLTPEDETHIELKRVLCDMAVSMRLQRGFSQSQLAEMLGTRQPNIARLERGGPAVGFDMLFKAIIALGATPTQIAGAIGGIKLTLPKASPRLKMPEPQLELRTRRPKMSKPKATRRVGHAKVVV